ncbi:hypothetical protein [Deinococcus sedimenti]|uniref:Uncharacterized protein n=1 Tax=Deinococcus sedimenti TaxID=1867090 RepID=A0ABQ2S087_9DEIO|nr:hypothetical protein [Deinococcus sedimenti]GGR84584.1 hypothetical protein GCM10008960_09520 [Deinococcus sedimenti]
MSSAEFHLLSLAGEMDPRMTEEAYLTLCAIKKGEANIPVERAVDLLRMVCPVEDDGHCETVGEIPFGGHNIIIGLEYTAKNAIIRVVAWPPFPEMLANPLPTGSAYSAEAYMTAAEYRSLAPDLHAGQAWYWNLREPGVRLDDSHPEAIW